MGLDITAYSRLKHVGKHAEDWCDLLDENDERLHVQAFAYDDFPQSFRGIPDLGRRAFGGGSAFIIGGCFEFTPETQEHRFRAGSYSGYNHWRADLQAQFNPGRDPSMPFFELIWFADNEGSIGPEAAADLLADFREHAGRYTPPQYYTAKTYDDWTRAFELAADGGLVRFH
jgi:hypothetical protein